MADLGTATISKRIGSLEVNEPLAGEDGIKHNEGYLVELSSCTKEPKTTCAVCEEALRAEGYPSRVIYVGERKSASSNCLNCSTLLRIYEHFKPSGEDNVENISFRAHRATDGRTQGKVDLKIDE